MDVFHYWKDMDADLKAGRVGYFKTSKEKLVEFRDRAPDYIWVFRTPKGETGTVRLCARVRWTDRATTTRAREEKNPAIFYDPEDAGSILFVDEDPAQNQVRITEWVKAALPKAIGSNFVGANAQHALDGDRLIRLRLIASSLATEPFANHR